MRRAQIHWSAATGEGLSDGLVHCPPKLGHTCHSQMLLRVRVSVSKLEDSAGMEATQNTAKQLIMRISMPLRRESQSFPAQRKWRKCPRSGAWHKFSYFACILENIDGSKIRKARPNSSNL